MNQTKEAQETKKPSLYERRLRHREVIKMKAEDVDLTNVEIGLRVGLTSARVGQIIAEKGV